MVSLTVVSTTTVVKLSSTTVFSDQLISNHQHQQRARPSFLLSKIPATRIWTPTNKLHIRSEEIWLKIATLVCRLTSTTTLSWVAIVLAGKKGGWKWKKKRTIWWLVMRILVDLMEKKENGEDENNVFRDFTKLPYFIDEMSKLSMML